MPRPQEIVDTILDSLPETPRRNAVASNPPLAEAIVYVLDKIEGGELAQGMLTRIYDPHLREEFNGPVIDTVRTYVRHFLKRDMRTGEAL